MLSEIPGQVQPHAAELVRLMGQDKKVRAGKLAFIMLRDVGQAFVTRDISNERVTQFLGSEIAAGR